MISFKNAWPLLALATGLLFSSCGKSKQAFKHNKKSAENEIALSSADTSMAKAEEAPEPPIPYRPARTRLADLVHMKLDITPVFARSEVEGEEELTFTTHFYPLDTLVLDARMMLISKVEWLEGKTATPILFAYDSALLKVFLPKTVMRGQNAVVRIQYTARPEKIKEKGGEAISEAKGFYFIDPADSDKEEPTEFWTQGEPESNSAWFPTIEAMEQKITQEIKITVPDSMVTLSNGTLQWSMAGKNHTRTDCWAQKLPHSVYLVMVAGGKYAIVKDTWKNKEVSYYVEPEFKKDARNIFGRTPEMIEFYSNLLKVPYAWDKYSQIVCREYVSGAMENTGAVVMFPAAQKTRRELIDQNYDDVICHELFHHWFGDLVTAKTWSQLFLNESMATYGEYLWIEHAKGRIAADEHLNDDWKRYLNEAREKTHALVRFYYNDANDLFDRHTYQKGALLLHALRAYVGDDAFFLALHNYLENNKFGNGDVEIFRREFEKVSGRDLRQWFAQYVLSAGHPQLQTQWEWLGDSVAIDVVQRQKQDVLYTIPLTFDVFDSNGKQRHNVVMTTTKQQFKFKAASKPVAVISDPEGTLFATLDEDKTTQEWARQAALASQYRPKYLALISLADTKETDSTGYWAVKAQTTHPDAKVRLLAWDLIGYKKAYQQPEMYEAAAPLVATEKDVDVRQSITQLLYNQIPAVLTHVPVMKIAMADSSYAVSNLGLRGVCEADSDHAIEIVKPFMADKHYSKTVTYVVGQYGTAKELPLLLLQSRNKDQDLSFSAMQAAYNIASRLHDDDAVFAQTTEIYVQTFTHSNVKRNRRVAFSGLGALCNLARTDSALHAANPANKPPAGNPAMLKRDTERAASIRSKMAQFVHTETSKEILAEIKEYYETACKPLELDEEK